MTRTIAFALFVLLLTPLWGFAQDCIGPKQGLETFVLKKQKMPPRLEIVPGPGTMQPCMSSVAPTVVGLPAWQTLQRDDAVLIDLDKDGTIKRLELSSQDAVSSVVKQAARDHGVNIK